MSDEVTQILAMLSDGKITAEEAEKLINALRPSTAGPSFSVEPGFGFGAFGGLGRGRGPRRRGWRSQRAHRGHRPRFLRIIIDEDKDGQKERVNIKVPLKLLRAGISLGGLMPKEAKVKINAALAAKGIEVDPFSLEGSDVDEIIEALSDLEIDADGPGEKVRIHVVYDEGDHDDDSDGHDVEDDDSDEDVDFDLDVVRKVKKGLKRTLKKKFSE